MMPKYKEPTSPQLVSSAYKDNALTLVYLKVKPVHKTLVLSAFRKSLLPQSVPYSRFFSRFRFSHLFRVLGFVISSLLIFLTLKHVFTYGVVHDKTLINCVVQQGDTLWAIASREDPTDDTQSVISWMIDHNHLGEGTIYPGEVLTVPVATS